MPNLGGMSPFPRRLGGGTPRVKQILDSLNADRGTALDASNRLTTVYVENMAIARAISAAWGTNERLGHITTPSSMSMDVLARWEKIMAIYPSQSESEGDRRERVAERLARFGQATTEDRITDLLTDELGSAFVAVEHIDYDVARILVPDASYPWGIVDGVPWSSTVAHILVRLQKPTGWSEADFYEAAGRVVTLLDPILPVWATVDWYRPGAVSANVAGGPSAAGFYLDEAANLDNQVFNADTILNPATWNLGGWWRAASGGDYDGSPWVGTASAGSSGSRDLAEGTNPATVGATLNAHPTANFDGTDDQMVSATAFDNLAGYAAGSMWVLFNADTAAADAGAGLRDQNRNLLCGELSVGLQTFHLTFSTAGVHAYYIGTDGFVYELTIACTTSAWHLVQVKWDSSTLSMRLDSGAFSTISAPEMRVPLGFMRVGHGLVAGTFFDGRIADIGMAKAVWSDANFESVRGYVNNRYSLSL